MLRGIYILFLFGLGSCIVGSKSIDSNGYLFPILGNDFASITDSLAEYKIIDYAVDKTLIEAYPVKVIRIGIHIVYDQWGLNNIPEYYAKEYIEKIIYNMNRRLEENNKMILPLGNETPVQPARWKVRLATLNDEPFVKFHKDEDYYWGMSSGPSRNNFDLNLMAKYGLYQDSIYNIFIQGHPKDSLTSQNFSFKIHGISFKNHCKLIGLFDPSLCARGKPCEMELLWPHWEVAKLLQHEIAHSLGLRHAWGNDGCTDTPRHTNCWNRTNNGSICDSLWSNNLMDYNAHQVAMTPCQIGKMRKNLIKKEAFMHRYVDRDWCENSSEQEVVISENTYWAADAFLNGNLVIQENTVLVVSAALSLPKNADIILYPGAKLYLLKGTLYSDCNCPWGGLKTIGNQRSNPAKAYACFDSRILMSNYSSI